MKTLQCDRIKTELFGFCLLVCWFQQSFQNGISCLLMNRNEPTRWRHLLSSSPLTSPGTRWSAGSAYSCRFSSACRCGPEGGSAGKRQRERNTDEVFVIKLNEADTNGKRWLKHITNDLTGKIIFRLPFIFCARSRKGNRMDTVETLILSFSQRGEFSV